MSSAKYELIPQTDADRNGTESDVDEDDGPEIQSTDDAELIPLESESVTTPEEVPHDPRFDQPVPSPYKRAALIIFMLFLFWLAFTMRKAQRQPKVIYASRCVVLLDSAYASKLTWVVAQILERVQIPTRCEPHHH